MITLEHFNQFVNDMNLSNSRLHKQKVLNKYDCDWIVRKYLQIAFDPSKTFGIFTKDLDTKVDLGNFIIQASILDLFRYLEKHNTGTTEDIIKCQRFIYHVEKCNPECVDLLKALICKDLSIGVDYATIKTVFN